MQFSEPIRVITGHHDVKAEFFNNQETSWGARIKETESKTFITFFVSFYCELHNDPTSYQINISHQYEISEITEGETIKLEDLKRMIKETIATYNRVVNEQLTESPSLIHYVISDEQADAIQFEEKVYPRSKGSVLKH